MKQAHMLDQGAWRIMGGMGNLNGIVTWVGNTEDLQLLGQ